MKVSCWKLELIVWFNIKNISRLTFVLGKCNEVIVYLNCFLESQWFL